MRTPSTSLLAIFMLAGMPLLSQAIKATDDASQKLVSGSGEISTMGALSLADLHHLTDFTNVFVNGQIYRIVADYDTTYGEAPHLTYPPVPFHYVATFRVYRVIPNADHEQVPIGNPIEGKYAGWKCFEDNPESLVRKALEGTSQVTGRVVHGSSVDWKIEYPAYLSSGQNGSPASHPRGLSQFESAMDRLGRRIAEARNKGDGAEVSRLSERAKSIDDQVKQASRRLDADIDRLARLAEAK